MTDQRPWRDREALTELAAGWNQHLADREIFRALSGPGWVGLLLAGEDRPSLYLLARSGATLLFDQRGPLPAAITTALGQTRRTPLNALLAGRKLAACAMLPADSVVAWRFAPAAAQGGELVLLHQLFGPRGNVVVLDRDQRLLWALHRPVHRVLSAWPPAATWSSTEATESADRPDQTESADQTTRTDQTARTDHTDRADDFRRAGLSHLSAALEVEQSNRLHQALRRSLASRERLITNLEPELASADQGAEYRRTAETLAVHLRSVPSGASEVELTDPVDGQPRRIALDPARSAVTNMERYFRRARKAKRGRDLIAERLSAARHEAEGLQDLAKELERILADTMPTEWHVDSFTTPRLAALLTWRNAHADTLGLDEGGKAGVKDRRLPDQPARPFRRYLIEERWEVWIGRSNAENDELTHRASAHHDIWLHVQGASGSHVILRTGSRPQDVPKRIIAKAAALAALHSKARNSTVVPVIYTERRYVRKPRRSPAGTATCLRHESLFVEPGLSADTEVI